MIDTHYPYYSIVTFGSSRFGRIRPWYRSLDRAIADARTLRGPSNVRIIGCDTRAEAIDADISGDHCVVWSR